MSISKAISTVCFPIGAHEPYLLTPSSEMLTILLQYISGICLTQYIVAFKTTSPKRHSEITHSEHHCFIDSI